MQFSESLKNNQQFRFVYKNGRSYANKYFIMYVKENGLDKNRIGISVSKKVGNSVVRHRITRLVRESYRLHESVFNSGLDMVIIARPGAASIGYEEAESALLHLAKLHHIIKIYFYNERILKEKQYIISKVENVLKGIKILSNNYKMIIITLKESFLKEMGIFKIEKTIHTNLDNYCAELIRNLKEEYLLENPCYPIEVIVKFFKIHNFLSEETLKYFNILEKNKYQKVFKIIETNIKLLPEDIEKKIFESLKIEKKKLEELIYISQKLTLEKYIFKLKLEKIIEIYLSKNIALKDIIGEYNLKDTNRINIYLKKIYRTNIKELKKENNLRNINTSEGDKKLKIKSKE